MNDMQVNERPLILRSQWPADGIPHHWKLRMPQIYILETVPTSVEGGLLSVYRILEFMMRKNE